MKLNNYAGLLSLIPHNFTPNETEIHTEQLKILILSRVSVKRSIKGTENAKNGHRNLHLYHELLFRSLLILLDPVTVVPLEIGSSYVICKKLMPMWATILIYYP